MSRRKSKKFNIDTRTAADVESRIQELSGLYDTGWHLDSEKPDIGTAISKIFASEMEENIQRVNDIMERYHTEFVNMLDISLLPAKPSAGYVIMDVLADTIDGASVPKGTKLIAGVGDEEIVFETDHSMYITGSNIASMFMTDGEKGTFSPIFGEYVVPRIYGEGGMEPILSEDEIDEETGEPLEITDAYSTNEVIRIPEAEPFTLYGNRQSIGMDAVVFYHDFLFNVGEDELFVRFADAEPLIEEIKSGHYEFKYISADGLIPVEHVTLLPDENTFVLQQDKAAQLVPAAGTKKSLLALVANGMVEAAQKTSSVSFSATGRFVPPENISDDNNDMPVDRFTPFTDILSVYNECFIGHDTYFAKKGARVTVSFELSFEEHRIALTAPEVDLSLKIIKKKPKTVDTEVYADAFVDEISIEYYNGIGWKRLATDMDISTIFAKTEARHIEFSFVVPDDWEPLNAGAYDGRSIRLQIMKSDNCYLRPAIHHYPVITDLKFSYSFEDTYLFADKIEMISGTRRLDITKKQNAKKDMVLFSVSDYKEDALYIGLTDRIQKGPVNLYFELDEQVRYVGLNTILEYSGPDGTFRQMKILDYTGNLSKTGVFAFVPPSDWVAAEIEGSKLYWLRLIRSKKESAYEDEAVLPKINRITLNAVQVKNVATRDEEEAYIEEVVPNMRFTIGSTGILDANVWVNEIGKFTQDQMRQMKSDDPDSYRIEEDAIGTITSFFVLWHETERFETSEDPRVYMLDRLTNELIFGDGVTTYIPSVIEDVAILFSVRCCDGALGNVEADTITDTMDSLPYIGDITNPDRSYGGSNIESIENALERGASILSSRRRLVTMGDYLRAIIAYSDTIDQVAGIVGETVEGEKDDSSLTFLLLMKDFADGSFAFHRVVSDLKEYLCKQCELTVIPEKLHLIEPVFVDISVSAWVTVVQLDDSFEIQTMLSDCLDEYLNPLGYENGIGWKIGTIPKKPQILMRLGILKSRAIVRKSVMIATYSDHEGYHEVDLEDLKVTPFMVCRSGKHEVHVIY
ncbi:MAG: hypothetical protein K5853_09515 [Lachnospiraceae bacterium]|nr:hypothetical protein [Lachnospiraceae bacterium]